MKVNDEVLQLCEDKNITLQAVDIAKVYPDVDAICESIKEKYEYRDQKYVLLIPNRIEDIIQEGRHSGIVYDSAMTIMNGYREGKAILHF